MLPYLSTYFRARCDEERGLYCDMDVDASVPGICRGRLPKIQSRHRLYGGNLQSTVVYCRELQIIRRPRVNEMQSTIDYT